MDSAQAWMLGLAAPLETLNGHRHDVLGGGPRGAPATYRMLRDLDITSRAAAIRRLDQLLGEAAKAKRPAWNLVRASAWAGAAYVAYFFDAQEAWSFIARAAKTARATTPGPPMAPTG
jgi:hypothetical protein